jgi:hypothetical protein
MRGKNMATEYEKKYGNEMTGLELLEDAIITSSMCEGPCTKCGACEHCEAEELGI